MQAMMTEQFGTLAQFLPMMSEGLNRISEAAEESTSGTYRVLIMEGSTSLARLLATGLKAESASVDVTQDLDSAMKMISKRSYNLLILDMDLPEVHGPSLLDDLRARRPEVRILVLSGRSGVDGLVSALDHGADDYLQKPFSLIEMMARARALRRRSDLIAPVAQPKSAKLVLRRDQCRVERDGRAIDLTPREFALLEYMVQHSGQTLSRSLLTQEVWNMPAETNTNIVDVYIKYLRDKLDGEFDDKLIRTVRGMGYLFQAQA